MKLNNKHNNMQNLPNYSSLSDVAEMLKNSNRTTRENKNCTIIADKSNINYNQVNSNISEIINQVIEEFNIQVLKVEETNINNSFKQNSKINNINNNNINNSINSNNNSYINQNYQNDINNNQNIISQNNSNYNIQKENKLKSNIKTEGVYINGFVDIFSLIQSIINNQEEILKEMK